MNNVTQVKTKAEQMLADQFGLALPGLPGSAAMRARRQEAFAAFERSGLPGRRLESWHYTDLRNMMREAALPGLSLRDDDKDAGLALADPLAAATPKHVAYVNAGRVIDSGIPAGVTFLSMSTALKTDHPLLARLGEAAKNLADPLLTLNDAFFSDGVLIHVARGVKIAEPLRVSSRFAGGIARASYARALVVLEEGASVCLVSSHLGPDGIAYQTNLVMEILLAEGAEAEFIRYCGAGMDAQVVTKLCVSMAKNCRFDTFALVEQAKLCRHTVHIAAKGEGSKVGVRGVNLLSGQQHADTTLVVDHQAPGCESRELFKTVVDGEATGVFQGKIVVRREAQQTDGRMASNAILLSDNATMNNKPELEIFADDVQCAHGVTCGALDENLLFYLQARGLPKKEAEALMLQAFCGEAIEAVSHEGLRDALNGIVAKWLKARST